MDALQGVAWPNWIDLLVVTLVIRGAYTGFDRGLLLEALHLSALISSTALVINCWGVLATWLAPWWPYTPSVVGLVAFIALYLTGPILLVRIIVRRLSDLIKWGPSNAVLHLLGLALGSVRGAWHAGMILLLLVATGWSYLAHSIEERSLLGRRLVPAIQQTLTEVADRFPGHHLRTQLMPNAGLRRTP